MVFFLNHTIQSYLKYGVFSPNSKLHIQNDKPHLETSTQKNPVIFLSEICEDYACKSCEGKQLGFLYWMC